MNIFYTDHNSHVAAVNLCDKHVVKMIVETAQMLSTAHRVLDGVETRRPSKSGKRMVKYWEHPLYDDVLYKATHVNHPSNIWIRHNFANYSWANMHFCSLCLEYKRRFGGNAHSTWTKLGSIITRAPQNIKYGNLTPILQAMPEEFKQPDGVEAYRAYYRSKKDVMKMNWTNRPGPEWFYA